MTKKRKNPAAVTLGRKGGQAYKKAHTAKERSDNASRAATERWRKWREAKALREKVPR